MPSREYLRVSLDDANRGRADGWTLAAGWFPYGTTWWAWFWRPLPNSESD